MGELQVLGYVFLFIAVCVLAVVIPPTATLILEDKETERWYQELTTISEEEKCYYTANPKKTSMERNVLWDLQTRYGNRSFEQKCPREGC